MESVNKTLYIPLYGKAYVSRRGLFLSDPWPERIWDAEGFALGGRSRSKWLAFYMGIRSAVFDDWVREMLAELPDAAVLHIGCGMDSRAIRIGVGYRAFYDIDFPEVIAERKKYYKEGDGYRMLEGDAREGEWLDAILEKDAIVVMEGVAMYLAPEELSLLFERLAAKFQNIRLLMDAYSVMAAKLSKYKNPINEVGVSKVYGIDDPTLPEASELKFKVEREMTPKRYKDELRGFEKFIFGFLYAGGIAKKIYRLYEYRK